MYAFAGRQACQRPVKISSYQSGQTLNCSQNSGYYTPIHISFVYHIDLIPNIFIKNQLSVEYKHEKNNLRLFVLIWFCDYRNRK